MLSQLLSEPLHLVIAIFASLVIGISKAGVKGIFALVVGSMAFVFGARASTGIIVPMLIVGDILAVRYYKRHVQWPLLFRFLPWVIIGVLLAVYFGKNIPEKEFLYALIIIILLSVVMMFLWERNQNIDLVGNPIFPKLMGIGAGFTTMIGNLAGAFSSLYFLSSKIPKNQFIGTAAWLFMIINVVKLPFHIFSWQTINVETIKTNLVLIPAVFFGFYLGVKLVALFGEQFFRKFILIATAFGAVFLLIRLH